MTKYLFLLGFSLCSISFLSGCKMSDFYSAPVTNTDSAPVAKADSDPVAKADSDPVAKTDSDPVADDDSDLVANADSAQVADADSARIVYTGIVYENQNNYAISCVNRKGVWKRLNSLIAAKEDTKKADVPAGYCQRGGFERFVLFEEVERTNNLKFVRSFVSPKFDGNEWIEAYVEIRADVQLLRCDNVNLHDEQWSRECTSNLALYDKHKADNDPLRTNHTIRRRSPDSSEE